jgi:hypothetical protein
MYDIWSKTCTSKDKLHWRQKLGLEDENETASTGTWNLGYLSTYSPYCVTPLGVFGWRKDRASEEVERGADANRNSGSRASNAVSQPQQRMSVPSSIADAQSRIENLSKP